MKKIIYIITLMIITALAAKSQPTISVVQNTNKYKVSIPQSWPVVSVETIPGSSAQTKRTTMMLELGDGNFSFGDNPVNTNNQKYFSVNATQVANTSTAFAFILTRYEDSARPKLFANIFTGQSSSVAPVINSSILKSGNPVINVEPYAPNAVSYEKTHFLISAKNRKGVIAFMYNESTAPVFSTSSLANDSFTTNNNIKLSCVRAYQGQRITANINEAKTNIHSNRQTYFDNCIKAYTQGDYSKIIFILNDGTDNSNINFFITVKPDDNISTIYNQTKIQAVFIPYNSDSSSCAKTMGYSATSFDPNYVTANPFCIRFADAATAFPADIHFTVHFQNFGLGDVDTVKVQHVLPHGFALGNAISIQDFVVGENKKAEIRNNGHVPDSPIFLPGVICTAEILNKTKFDSFDTLVLKFFYKNAPHEKATIPILKGIHNNPYAAVDPATRGYVSYAIQFSPAARQLVFPGGNKKPVVNPGQKKLAIIPVDTTHIIPSLEGKSKVHILFHTMGARTEQPVTCYAQFDYCELLPRVEGSINTR